MKSRTTNNMCRPPPRTVTAVRHRNPARSPLITVGTVADNPSSQTVTLSQLATLAQRAAEARRAERAALDERADAIVAAVRAGARLDEIGDAAGMTKAAASAIARKTLAARSGRGGPYRRRRGAGAALERVAHTARQASDASRDAHQALLERNRSVLAGADRGLNVPSMAEAMGMGLPAAHELIRRCRREAMNTPNGTIAS